MGCSFISSFDWGRIHFQAYSIAGRIHFLCSTGLRASVFGWLLASSFPHLSFLTYGLSIEQLTVQLLALSKPARERESILTGCVTTLTNTITEMICHHLRHNLLGRNKSEFLPILKWKGLYKIKRTRRQGYLGAILEGFFWPH